MFEIVVDKKLVPKEVLETGGKKTENLSPNNIMTSHIALCFYFVHMMGISPKTFNPQSGELEPVVLPAWDPLGALAS